MQDYWQQPEYARYLNLRCATEATPQQGNFVVKGQLRPHQPANAIVKYFAAAPPDFMTNYAGSGLPFPNPDVAYEGTPNVGAVQATNGAYSFKVWFPNSFYVDMGTKLVPPHVLIKVCAQGANDEIDAVVLGDPIPNRSLTNLPEKYSRASFKTRQWDEVDLAAHAAGLQMP